MTIPKFDANVTIVNLLGVGIQDNIEEMSLQNNEAMDMDTSFDDLDPICGIFDDSIQRLIKTDPLLSDSITGNNSPTNSIDESQSENDESSQPDLGLVDDQLNGEWLEDLSMFHEDVGSSEISSEDEYPQDAEDSSGKKTFQDLLPVRARRANIVQSNNLNLYVESHEDQHGAHDFPSVSHRFPQERSLSLQDEDTLELIRELIEQDQHHHEENEIKAIKDHLKAAEKEIAAPKKTTVKRKAATGPPPSPATSTSTSTSTSSSPRKRGRPAKYEAKPRDGMSEEEIRKIDTQKRCRDRKKLKLSLERKAVLDSHKELKSLIEKGIDHEGFLRELLDLLQQHIDQQPKHKLKGERPPRKNHKDNSRNKELIRQKQNQESQKRHRDSVKEEIEIFKKIVNLLDEMAEIVKIISQTHPKAKAVLNRVIDRLKLANPPPTPSTI